MRSVSEQSQEVLVATERVVRIAAADLDEIRTRTLRSARRRARLCAHPDPADPLHEMIICLARGTYIRPHRHPGKSESFHMIEGELEVVLFENDGAIREVIRMGPYSSGAVFFYRLAEPCFHTVLVRSPHVLFHETTNGPFDPADTEFAPWSPAAGDAEAGRYIQQLDARIDR